MNNKLSWHYVVFLLFVGLAGLLASPVRADSNFYGFVSTLDGAQQVPANGSPAKGTSKASYDPTTNKLNLSIIVTGISPTNLTGAHIHLGPKGSSGAVVVNLGTTTWQATSTGMTLSAPLTFPEANELDLINGNTYLNLHTSAFPGGEIRGQIIMAAKLVTIKAGPTGVSADGKTVAGSGLFGTNSPQDFLAYKWTPTSGVQPIPPPANAAINCGQDYEGCRLFIEAGPISDNGEVIAGQAFTSHATGDSFEAFRWTSTAGYLGLDNLGLFPAGSSAGGISADGSTIVGSSNSFDPAAFRWTAATGLVKFPGGFKATGTSGNGAVSIGVNNTGFGSTALMWPNPNQAVQLPPLIGGYTSSASAISSNALIIAGYSDTNSSTTAKAVRWTTTDSPLLPVVLDAFPNETGSNASGISGDGKTIVGLLGRSTSSNSEVFVWTALTGKRLLADLMIERGLDLSNLRLSEVRGISRDANTIIGNAYFNVPPDGINFLTGYIVYLNPAVTLPQPPPPPPQPPASSDMVLTMTDSPDPVRRLFKLTYTMKITNNGPSDTGSVVLTYSLPSNVTFLSLTMPPGVSCTGSPVVTCKLYFLAKGASTTVIHEVRPKSTGKLTATGSVTSILADPNTANNKATVTTTVY